MQVLLDTEQNNWDGTLSINSVYVTPRTYVNTTEGVMNVFVGSFIVLTEKEM